MVFNKDDDTYIRFPNMNERKLIFILAQAKYVDIIHACILLRQHFEKANITTRSSPNVCGVLCEHSTSHYIPSIIYEQENFIAIAQKTKLVQMDKLQFGFHILTTCVLWDLAYFNGLYERLSPILVYYCEANLIACSKLYVKAAP
jgi:hypothetical protein